MPLIHGEAPIFIPQTGRLSSKGSNSTTKRMNSGKLHLPRGGTSGPTFTTELRSSLPGALLPNDGKTCATNFTNDTNQSAIYLGFPRLENLPRTEMTNDK